MMEDIKLACSNNGRELGSVMIPLFEVDDQDAGVISNMT